MTDETPAPVDPVAAAVQEAAETLSAVLSCPVVIGASVQPGAVCMTGAGVPSAAAAVWIARTMAAQWDFMMHSQEGTHDAH